MKKGLVHIYTGDGKGKTTAGFGLALRAVAAGFKVCAFQFLKGGGRPAGEVLSAKKLGRNFKVVRFDQIHPLFQKGRRPEQRQRDIEELKVRMGIDLEEVRAELLGQRYDLVILDEVLCALKDGYVKEKDLLDLIDSKPHTVELVLTGRGATQRLIERADYVTEMREIKHPFVKGVKARKGIED